MSDDKIQQPLQVSVHLYMRVQISFRILMHEKYYNIKQHITHRRKLQTIVSFIHFLSAYNIALFSKNITNFHPFHGLYCGLYFFLLVKFFAQMVIGKSLITFQFTLSGFSGVYAQERVVHIFGEEMHAVC